MVDRAVPCSMLNLRGCAPCLPSPAELRKVSRAGWPIHRSRSRAAGIVNSKLDSLRQRKLRGKINRVRLAAHITFPGIAPAFASAAGIFLAAESAANFGATRTGVDVCDPAIAPNRAHEFLRLADVICENRTG